MDEKLITGMREMLAKHAPSGLQSCQQLFADNPEESAAALKQMAALRDAYMYPPTCQQLMHHGPT